MPEGTCQFCGKFYKAVQVHEPRCKQNPKNIIFTDTEPEQPKPQSIVTNINKSKTDEEKFLNFFGNLPRWDIPERKGLKKLFKNKQKYLPCVFVADNEDPRIAYVPYDPSMTVLTTEEGTVYDIPITGNVAFFHRDKFMPLVNTRNVSEKYDIPEHHALSLYNLGRSEGQLMAFKELIDNINKLFYTKMVLYAVVAIVLIGSILITKSYGEAVAQITGFVEGV